MGGSPIYLVPVIYRGLSSWEAHQHRIPPSQEPGTDFYTPIGTPVFAPADGYIYGYGNSIAPATGRWVGVQFDNGMSFRAMHFSRIVKFSGRVQQGDLIAFSGASGYGDEDWSWNPNTGGAHVHVTLWPSAIRQFGYNPNTGLPYTIDFMNYAGDTSAGGGTTPPKEWDEMATKDEIKAAFREVSSETNAPSVKIVGTPEGKQFLVGPGGAIHIKNTGDASLLRRHIKAVVSGEETFTEGQVAIIASYLRQAVIPNNTPALKIVGVVGGVMWLAGPGGTKHIEGLTHLDLLRRYIAAPLGGEETFTQTQVDIIQSYLSGLA